VIPSRSPTPVSQRLLNLSCIPAGSWALALPPDAWYDSLGCGIWFNSFSFLVPRPRSEGNTGLPVGQRRIWPAAQDLLTKASKKILLDIYPTKSYLSKQLTKEKQMNTILPELIFAAAVFAILFKTGVLIW